MAVAVASASAGTITQSIISGYAEVFEFEADTGEINDVTVDQYVSSDVAYLVITDSNNVISVPRPSIDEESHCTLSSDSLTATCTTELNWEINDQVESIYLGDEGDTYDGNAFRVYGEGGRDTLVVSDTGGQILDGGSGNDTLTSSGGPSLYGGSGNDTIWGSSYSDWIYPEDGADVVFARGGDDHIRADDDAGWFNDSINCGAGSDDVEADNVARTGAQDAVSSNCEDVTWTRF